MLGLGEGLILEPHPLTLDEFDILFMTIVAGTVALNVIYEGLLLMVLLMVLLIVMKK